MTAYYNENDPYAAQWLRNLIAAGHIAPGEVDERDIRDVRPDDLKHFAQCHFFAGLAVWSLALRNAGWDDSRPVWTGSCPCQPFSAAGEGAGVADERHLWPAWHHLIGECRPPVVYGEQVASKAGLGWLDLVQADMEGTGYAFGAADLCAASAGEDAKGRICYKDNTFEWKRIVIGAPHIRQRLYWVAERSEHAESDGRQERRAEPSGGRVISRRGTGGLANAPGERGDRRQGSAGPNGRQGFEAGSTVSGLADAAGERPLPGAYPGVHSGEESPRPRDGEPERPSSDGRLADTDNKGSQGRNIRRNSAGERSAGPDSMVGGLADTDRGQRFGVTDGKGRECDGQATRRQQGDSGAQPGGATGGVADADGTGTKREAGDTPKTARLPETKRKPEYDADVPERGRADNDRRTTSGSDGLPSAPEQSDAHNGFWRDADWLFCRDGKWRPVESGTFPLAPSSPGRVGKLRAYGNSICAEVARVFIEETSLQQEEIR